MAVENDNLAAFGVRLKVQYRGVAKTEGEKPYIRFFGSLADAFEWVDSFPERTCKIDRRLVGPYVSLASE